MAKKNKGSFSELIEALRVVVGEAKESINEPPNGGSAKARSNFPQGWEEKFGFFGVPGKSQEAEAGHDSGNRRRNPKEEDRKSNGKKTRRSGWAPTSSPWLDATGESPFDEERFRSPEDPELVNDEERASYDLTQAEYQALAERARQNNRSISAQMSREEQERDDQIYYQMLTETGVGQAQSLDAGSRAEELEEAGSSRLGSGILDEIRNEIKGKDRKKALIKGLVWSEILNSPKSKI